MKNQLKVVVIEDEPSVKENLVTLLESEGFIAASASSGDAGLNLIRSFEPDVVICDIMMPGLSGYDVLKTVRQDKDIKPMPFIFLTAKSEVKDFRQGMELGADDYIFKPYKADELLSAIKMRLQKIKEAEDYYVTQQKSDNPISRKKEIEDQIFLTIKDKLQLVKFSDIKHICADRQYTELTLVDEKSHLIRKSLNEWEDLLPAGKFLRIHRSSIINLGFVENIEKWYQRSYKVTLKNCAHEFIVSKRYASKIKNNLIE